MSEELSSLRVRLTGVSPLLMHNSNLVDPTNPFVIQMKKITSKGTKKMTPNDCTELAFLEAEGGSYYDPEVGYYIPTDNVHRMIRDGATENRNGEKVKAAVLIKSLTGDEGRIKIKGVKLPKDFSEIRAAGLENNKFLLKRVAKLPKGPHVVRTRLQVPPGWQLDVEIDYNAAIIGEADLSDALMKAGLLKGLGDWRPRHGRFAVEKL